MFLRGVIVSLKIVVVGWENGVCSGHVWDDRDTNTEKRTIDAPAFRVQNTNNWLK